jgi:UPF0755 protein
MKTLERIFSPVFYLWLAGVVFLLCGVGYCIYSVLWIIRYMQTRKTLLWVVIFLSLMAFVAGGAGLRFFLYPWHQSSQSVEITVPAKATVRAIADSLIAHRIISTELPFLVWLKWSGIERRVQAGRYSFFPGEGIISASEKLTHAAPNDIVITIPEGLTIGQTGARIAHVLPIDSLEFERLCGDTAFIRSLGFDGIPTLEGYLFPDTYRLLESVDCATIIQKMVARFKEKYASIDSSGQAPGGLSRHEIVTLASIVEKEAVLASERPRIAGVFYNRLRLGFPLGADPTVRYIFKKWNGPLFVSELNSNSPYNTRRFAGLPPGPICSPGFASLAAAVSPLKTNELYFVAKWDGSGAHEFSVTNAEHSRKKIKIRKQNERRLREKAGS